jgi:hypothetical protein
MQTKRTYAAFLIAGLTAACTVPAQASAIGDTSPELVGLENAGPGPQSVTLVIRSNGVAVLTRERQGRSVSRTFAIEMAEIQQIETRLASARLANAEGSYGLPNPGGVFSIVTAEGRSVTVYASAIAPPALRQLIATLEQFVTTHK